MCSARDWAKLGTSIYLFAGWLDTEMWWNQSSLGCWIPMLSLSFLI